MFSILLHILLHSIFLHMRLSAVVNNAELSSDCFQPDLCFHSDSDSRRYRGFIDDTLAERRCQSAVMWPVL